MPWINKDGTQASVPESFIIDDFEVDQVAENMGHPVIVTNFDSYQDGRAFSWCTTLRAHGYQGKILAGGQVGIDRLDLVFRVGYTAAWLTDQEYSLLQPGHLKPFIGGYQSRITGEG
ncbi:MAG: DUF934 domain-containing protein [Proteobacteria bacterium]|nr:DUF934 domain-containing protein [Pseudomonadota bacterium]